MKRLFIIFITLVLGIAVTACGNIVQSSETSSVTPESIQQEGTEISKTESAEETSIRLASDSSDEPKNTVETEDITSMKMNVEIGGKSFIATLEDNDATRELIDMMKEAPISISMRDYSGFEKVGSLGRSLTTDNHQTTTSAGDIVLYNGNQIVMFYGSNSWSYTMIGKIDDLSGWEDALGSGNITAVFSLVE